MRWSLACEQSNRVIPRRRQGAATDGVLFFVVFLFFSQKLSSPHSLLTWCLLGGRQAQQFASLISKAPWEKIFTILCLTFFFFSLFAFTGKRQRWTRFNGTVITWIPESVFYADASWSKVRFSNAPSGIHSVKPMCRYLAEKPQKENVCVCVGRKKKRVFKKKNRVNFVWIVLLTQQSQVKASFTFLLRSSAVTSEHTSKCLCVSEVTQLPPI